MSFTARSFDPPQSTGDLRADLDNLRLYVAELVRQFNLPGTVKLSQATVEDTIIGASNPSSSNFTTIGATGQITSTLASGMAPLVIASTTKVANLNADKLDDADWAAPAAIGTGTPAAATFTTLNVNTSSVFPTGTITPGISFGGGTTGITYTTQTGSYLRIGGYELVNGLITLSSKGSSTGAARITGLHGTVRNDADSYAAPALRLSVVTYTGTPQAFFDINTTTAVLEQMTEAGTRTSLADTNFSNTSSILFGGIYRVL